MEVKGLRRVGGVRAVGGRRRLLGGKNVGVGVVVVMIRPVIVKWWEECWRSVGVQKRVRCVTRILFHSPGGEDHVGCLALNRLCVDPSSPGQGEKHSPLATGSLSTINLTLTLMLCPFSWKATQMSHAEQSSRISFGLLSFGGDRSARVGKKNEHPKP